MMLYKVQKGTAQHIDEIRRSRFEKSLEDLADFKDRRRVSEVCPVSRRLSDPHISRYRTDTLGERVLL